MGAEITLDSLCPSCRGGSSPFPLLTGKYLSTSARVRALDSGSGRMKRASVPRHRDALLSVLVAGGLALVLLFLVLLVVLAFGGLGPGRDVWLLRLGSCHLAYLPWSGGPVELYSHWLAGREGVAAEVVGC